MVALCVGTFADGGGSGEKSVEQVIFMVLGARIEKRGDLSCLVVAMAVHRCANWSTCCDRRSLLVGNNQDS